MSARLRREALRSFRYALDQVLGCVTPTPSIVRQRPTSDRIEFEFETPGAFVPLRAAGGLGLRVRLRAQIGPEADGRSWRASITAYQYALHAADGREYLAYHWHPDGASPVAEPHLHLGPAAQVGVARLAAAHLPTGPVDLPAVVRLAVDAWRARPLRRDWAAVLSAAAPAFDAAGGAPAGGRAGLSAGAVPPAGAPPAASGQPSSRAGSGARRRRRRAHALRAGRAPWYPRPL